MHKLQFLRDAYGHLPPQGSDAWLQSRKTKIGGSEMATVLSRNPYMKSCKFVESKKTAKWSESAPCTFGRVFEVVAKQHMAQHGVTIHELGAIPSPRLPVCYSPDGVIVEEDDLVLLEIKCPWRRRKIGTVPDQYMCQIQTGMNILPCDRCYFYQFRFRLCVWEDLGPSVRYNRGIHYEWYKNCPPKKPLRWGYIHWPGKERLEDLGALTADTADNLCVIVKRRMEIHWESTEVPQGGYVLPFKLFDETKLEVDRDQGFLDDCAGSVWDVFKQLL